MNMSMLTLIFQQPNMTNYAMNFFIQNDIYTEAIDKKMALLNDLPLQAD